jgi:hypothetical protein
MLIIALSMIATLGLGAGTWMVVAAMMAPTLNERGARAGLDGHERNLDPCRRCESGRAFA